MKTKLLLSALLAFYFCLLSSQVPQGFNYQAIARDGSGNPIKNTSLPVTITIQSDSTSGTIFWKELHSSVVTNGFGMFTLIIGKGAKQPASTVDSFKDVDWTISPKFIKTEIYYQSELMNMGSSRLWTVPYSMVAGGLGGTLDKLQVTGKTTSPEEALFEVKNKDDQTVFAVYNEGVRIYVDDGVGTKKAKGGFAVGGFGTSKAPSQEYFIVNADSIRAYIYDDPLVKKAKGGFAVGGFGTTKGLTNDYFLISPDSARIYVDNAPSTKGEKGGFAIGGFDVSTGINQKFLTISTDSIRMYIDDISKKAKGGFAVGGFGTSKGENASFLNVATDASGIINPSQNRVLWYPIKNAFLAGRVRIGTPDSVGVNSFATGYESKSRGMYSQAMGFKTIANGDYSTAIGKNALANNINSFSFGDSARATNAEAYAIGRGAVASGYRSFAFGSAGVDFNGKVTDVASALGDYSFAIGQGSKSIGRGSFCIGLADTAQGNYSTAIGYKTIATNYYSTAIGYLTKASGYYSTAMGCTAIASNVGSTSIGYGTKATGENSTAFGYNATASASYSTAMGYYTVASGWLSTATGRSTKATGDGSTSMGSFTTAKGYYSTAMGFYTNAKPRSSLAIGQYNDSTCSALGHSNWTSSDPLFIAGNGSSGSLSNALTLYKNGNLTIAGTLTQGSDLRIKENISSFTNGYNIIEKINPVYFFFKDKNIHPDGRQIGVIAQELKEVLPELVQEDGRGFLSVDYSKLTVVLIQAVKEQQQQIESVKQENYQLKSKLDELKALVNTLIANQTAQINN